MCFQLTLPLTLLCTDSAQPRGFLGWPPGLMRLTAFPSVLGGQDETLGTHASHVKSSERKPRPRRSADSEPLSPRIPTPGSPARVTGSGSPLRVTGLRSVGDELDAGHRAPAPAEHEEPAV